MIIRWRSSRDLPAKTALSISTVKCDSPLPSSPEWPWCVALSLITRSRLGANAASSSDSISVCNALGMAAFLGVAGRVVHAYLGADAGSDSLYAQSKAAGEAAVLAAFPTATILRPSVIFGPEDQFFNRFAGMARLGPILPVVGAATRFQPVYVDDVAQAAVAGVLGKASGVYELGGPDAASFRDLMTRMLGVIQRRRLVLNIPFIGARIMAFGFDTLQFLTGGLLKNGMITADQVRSLRRDNVVTPGAKGLNDLGIVPTAMAAVLPEYLWRYRPSGQYAAIKDSAKNLRKH